MTENLAIKVSNVSKSFKLPHEKQRSIKGVFVNMFRGKTTYEKQQVLKDISFDIKRGEFFGIVGRNGSGKSTLLKLMAGIYSPNKGRIEVNGKLTPFIELGVGFNPELTGRENVFLNGALLGFSRQEIESMYNEIVEFAELEKFMDQRLKNYSSGMQVRLAFSIAIQAKGDILLLDEVLAVGDSSFQEKCFSYFDQLKRNKKTVILVSHDMNAIRQYCTSSVLVSEGKIVYRGKPEEVAVEYERLNFSNKETSLRDNNKLKVRTLSEDLVEAASFEFGKKIIFDIRWPINIEPTIVGVIIYKNKELIFATNSKKSNVKMKNGIKFEIINNFGNGRYKVRVGLFGKNRHDKIGIFDGGEFIVYNQPTIGKKKEEWEGLMYLENRWLDG